MTDFDQSDILDVRWSVNSIVSTSPSWQPYITSNGITAVGTAHNTTLTIPGVNTALNQTTMRCIALGQFSNGSYYVNTDSDTLYIQGMILFYMYGTIMVLLFE